MNKKARRTNMPQGETVSECLNYIEDAMRKLRGSADRSFRAGKTLTLTPINVGILSSRSLTAVTRAKELLGKVTVAMLLLVVISSAAQAEPRQRDYILRRQEAGSVEGVPTMRRIIGKREIDIYRDGSMFEKDNYVGHTK